MKFEGANRCLYEIMKTLLNKRGCGSKFIMKYVFKFCIMKIGFQILFSIIHFENVFFILFHKYFPD